MEYLGFCAEFDPSRGTKEEYDALRKELHGWCTDPKVAEEFLHKIKLSYGEFLLRFSTNTPSTSSSSSKRKASAADDYGDNEVVDRTVVGDIGSTSDTAGKENKKKTTNTSTKKRQKIEKKNQLPGFDWNKYLNALKDSGKLKKRQNAYFQMRLERWISEDVTADYTHTQLKRYESDVARFVVKGTTTMKKILQLCAYLSGELDTYDYNSQRGKSLVTSMCLLVNTLTLDTMILASKATKKKCASLFEKDFTHPFQNVFVEAKTVKIAQIFQGLCMSYDGGIVYDSEKARTLNSRTGGLRISLPSESGQEHFTLVAEGILPREWCTNKSQPLPRVVGSRWAFGQNAVKMNCELQGKRQGPGMLTFAGTSDADVMLQYINCRLKPVCHEDGRCLNPFFHDAMYKYLEEYSPPAIKTEANKSEEAAAAADSAVGSASAE
eukprot:g1155.t1